ncbi:MAG: hypothetical protein FWD24_04385 [Treponema sp.]|nr:hypothetical protein [Treponema sp.]
MVNQFRSTGSCGSWLIIFLFFLSTNLFAQGANPPWWLSLEYGKQRFRSQDYGVALMLFEDARRNRRAMYEQMERDLISLLSVNEVRRLGDYLDRVERFSNERHYTAASAALEELYYRVPKASLNNSANAALTAIGKLKDYPEAEYWIGEVYRVEGELSLALSQYRRAYTMRSNLENPDFSTTLQYNIASVLRTRQEYDEMISILDLIIAENDTLWTDARAAENTQTGSRGETLRPSHQQASASFARTAMTSTLTNHGINRFLEMYRYNNSAVEQAHRLLGFHLVVSGRPTAEAHLMFAFLIQNTIIIEEVRRRQFDFTFTNLQDLAREINRNQLLLSYIEEVEYYKTIYYFGASLFRNGKNAVSRSVWEFLASQPQAGEWHDRAVSQLRNPRFETIVTMP